MLAQEREARDVGGVETGGADEDVQGVRGSGAADAGGGSYFGDFAVYYCYVVGGQGFQVVDTWGGTTAAYSGCWDDFGFEFGVLEGVSHLVSDVGAHVGLCFAVREEENEGAVDSRFVLLAEFEENSGVFLVAFDFCFCICTGGFWTKRSEDPGSLTDKAGEMGNGWLDCFKDLLPRRSMSSIQHNSSPRLDCH